MFVLRNLPAISMPNRLCIKTFTFAFSGSLNFTDTKTANNLYFITKSSNCCFFKYNKPVLFHQVTYFTFNHKIYLSSVDKTGDKWKISCWQTVYIFVNFCKGCDTICLAFQADFQYTTKIFHAD